MKLNTSKVEWDLSPLFKKDNKKLISRNRKEVLNSTENFVKKWKGRNDYLRSPEVLKEVLDEYNSWARECGASEREFYYFHLKSSKDQINTDLKAKLTKATEFSKSVTNSIQFFELELAKINPNLQTKFLKDKSLQQYRHFLEKLFLQAKHNLSDPEEKIMNLKSTTSKANWVRMTSTFLSKEEKSVLDENGKKSIKSFSEINSLMNNKKKIVRDTAAGAFNEILQIHVEVAEHEINSILLNKKIDDELRSFSRPDSARHLHDDMETKTVDTIVNSVSRRFEISQKFYGLKAKLIKQPKLGYHERAVEYGKFDKKYTFKEGVTLVYETFTKLDKEFAEIFKGFIENGQIDAFPAKGKRGGAFCSYGLITHPTYILLNYTDQVNDVLTLAHEAGHGINNELIKKKQNALNFGTPTSTAEVASTFMEDFVLQELMEKADNKLKLALMMQKLNDDIGTIFRQIAFYNFETKLHTEFREKGYLSKDEIGDIFRQTITPHTGKSVSFQKENENWWVYIPHFRYFFYVYSYAGGLLISKALQAKVKENANFVSNVKQFLSTGLSDSPKNMFKKLGINISDKKFWDKGLDEVESLLDETESLAKKLGEI